MVDLNSNPKCEVICPYESCKFVIKLGLIKQVNLNAPLKFNTFNFERHINNQHVNKKRKSHEENISPVKKATRNETLLDTLPCDISENLTNNQDSCLTFSNPLHFSTPVHSPITPKTKNIQNLRKELSVAIEKIKELENNSSIQSICASSMTPKAARIEKLSTDLRVVERKAKQFQSENIMIRHKLMDAYGKIRTICRVKPESTECFIWQRSEDGSIIELSMYY